MKTCFLTLCLLALSACSSDCQLLSLTACNLVNETCLCTDEISECLADRCAANANWLTLRKYNPGCPFSQDFARGFKEGYVDFMAAGPRCTPPLPPRCYWSWHTERRRGKQAIQDWIAGFSQGAAAAQGQCPRAKSALPFVVASRVASAYHPFPMSASPGTSPTPLQAAQPLAEPKPLDPFDAGER